MEFYVGILGLTERADRPDFSFDGAWLDAGPQQVHLIKADVPPDRGQHFALAVTDLDGAVAELRGRGLRVTDPAPVGTGRQSSSTTRPATASNCSSPAANHRKRRCVKGVIACFLGLLVRAFAPPGSVFLLVSVPAGGGPRAWAGWRRPCWFDHRLPADPAVVCTRAPRST